MNAKQTISSTDLLQIANTLMQSQEGYIEGMYADSVTEKEGVLVFKGNYFLDEKGLPTLTTTTVFNLFKFLALELSKIYTLSATELKENTH